MMLMFSLFNGERLCVSQEEALGFEKSGSVTGSVNGLVKKGYAERFKEEVETEDGKTKTVSFFCLTEAGAAFDPDADIAE